MPLRVVVDHFIWRGKVVLEKRLHEEDLVVAW